MCLSRPVLRGDTIPNPQKRQEIATALIFSLQGRMAAFLNKHPFREFATRKADCIDLPSTSLTLSHATEKRRSRGPSHHLLIYLVFRSNTFSTGQQSTNRQHGGKPHHDLHLRRRILPQVLRAVANDYYQEGERGVQITYLQDMQQNGPP